MGNKNGAREQCPAHLSAGVEVLEAHQCPPHLKTFQNHLMKAALALRPLTPAHVHTATFHFAGGVPEEQHVR